MTRPLNAYTEIMNAGGTPEQQLAAAVIRQGFQAACEGDRGEYQWLIHGSWPWLDLVCPEDVDVKMLHRRLVVTAREHGSKKPEWRHAPTD